jgi:hypothetical protein
MTPTIGTHADVSFSIDQIFGHVDESVRSHKFSRFKLFTKRDHYHIITTMVGRIVS